MKYNNKKTKVDGIIFHSKLEADYYEYLKKCKNEGKIKDFELQPKVVLIPSFKDLNGATIRSLNYILDFKVIHIDDSIEFIDTKGFETDVSKIKKKLFKYLNPEIKISWVCRCGEKYSDTGFIDKDLLKKIQQREVRRMKYGK